MAACQRIVAAERSTVSRKGAAASLMSCGHSMPSASFMVAYADANPLDIRT